MLSGCHSFVVLITAICPRDCEDVLLNGPINDGVYTIEIGNYGNERLVDVYCELSNDIAWTVSITV